MPPQQARLSQAQGQGDEGLDPSLSLGGEVPPSSGESASTPLRESSLLPFARSIIRSIVPSDDEPLDEGDALIILAKGLGLRSIVAHILKIYDAPTNLVLLINARPEEEAGLSEELTTLGVRKPGLRSVGYETAQKTRKSMYASGGIISVTSQILIVDMLLEIVPVELITGLIFLHAEDVTPESNEAFIAGVFRDRNQDGFLKAFSDNAEAFAIGISPLQTVLGKLRVRKVELWPRFHKSVIRDLGERKADVVELHQPLSRSMRIIQTAVVECLDATLGELKRSVSSIEVGEYTLENAIFQAFDVIVQRQLQPVWHRLGFKTKRLVNDLRELRRLLNFLISYDAVTFYEYLETLRAAQTAIAGSSALSRMNLPDWMLLDAANTIFQHARARAYLGEISAAAAETEAATASEHADGDEDEQEVAFGAKPSRSWKPRWLPPGIEPVLEELPKWHLLREVMDEIEQEIHFSEQKQEDLSPNNTILVMTASDRSCWQVRSFLSTMDDSIIGPQEDEGEDGEAVSNAPGRKLMQRSLRNHFRWKVSMGRMTTNLKTGGAPTATTATTPASEDPSKQPYESEALKRKVPWERGQAPPTKRRRQRGGMVTSATSRQSRDPVAAAELMEQEAADFAGFYDRAMETIAGGAEEEQDEGGEERADADADANADLEADTSGLEGAADFEITGFSEAEFDNYFGVLNMDSLIVVRPYRGDNDDNVLRELRPRFIIMYDPDPAFVRRVELYRASTLGANPRVYFLLYAESVEEQRYLSSMRREKESFEKLIREKSIMALPLQADGRPAQEDADDRMLRSINSRIAGGQRGVSNEPPRIVVDMREFKSSLPPMLYFAGIKVIPCTLQVGDYILSPEMCVERKSLQDLVQSFNSGRLYTQCELMSIHYQHPILLIEFPQDKAFALQTMLGTKSKGSGAATAAAITAKTNPSDIDVQTKLVMLVTQFPRLRVIWSSSPHHTADVFMELKSTYAEPDLSKVAAVGLADDDAAAGAGATGGDGRPSTGSYENSFNLTPQDFLRSMPGITTKNYRLVMNTVRDLDELCDLSKAELKGLLGAESSRALWQFIHKDIKGGRRGGLDAGAGSYDQEVYADKGGGEGVGVQGGSQDFSSKHSEGLDGGKGTIDSQRGLSEGFDGGSGDADNRPGQGFNAGTDGARSGGGTTLNAGAGDVDENGAEGVTNLGDKLKEAGQSLRDRISNPPARRPEIRRSHFRRRRNINSVSLGIAPHRTACIAPTCGAAAVPHPRRNRHKAAPPDMASTPAGSSAIVHFKGHANFRSRLVLSLLSQRPILITAIRPNSLSPGLRDFEASFLRLLEKVTNGSKVEISYTGTTVKFLPGTIAGGDVTHDCGTARGVGYFLEWIALLAPFAKKELTLTLKGITSMQGDMGADLLRTVQLPWLSQFLPPSTSLASPLELRIVKRGHPPLGGGEIFFRCPLLPNVSSAGVGAAGGGGGGMLKTINFVNAGKVKRIRGIATAARVSPAMANRMVERARKTLNRFVPDLYIFADVYRGDDSGKSPGFALSLLTQSTTSATHYAEAHSSPGVVPEDVASSCVASLLSSLSTWSGCVPPGLQAQTLLLMAASPEDVSRCKMGKKLTPAAIQILRDLEAVWGLRFMMRRVEAPRPQADAGGDSDEGDDDDDDDDDAIAAKKRSKDSRPSQPQAADSQDELVLSCRGVGVRGARKAT
ncbi:unnamed protein product [Parajaminaea phylloscopi]